MNKGIKPKFLMLLITNNCNLNCVYCYKDKHSKIQDMPFEIAEKSLILAGSSKNYFHVQLTGGEPLLNPELIERLAKFIYKKNLTASIGIQTNGTLLDNALINIFKRYKIQVSISIDGPPEIQEILRDKSNKVFEKLRLLAKNEVPFKVVSVISNLNINFLPKLLLLLSTFPNFEGIALSLLVKKGQALKNPQIKLPDIKKFKAILKEFLKTLDLVNRIRLKPVKFRELEIFKNRVEKNLKYPFCFALKGKSLAVCPDGTLYPCSQTVDDPNFFSGTLEKLNFDGFLALKKISILCPEDCPSRTYYNNAENKKLIHAMHKIFREHLDFGGKN
ncbi:radical SAM protein [Thermodesulfobacterium hydrogeniphilum]|uniref:radical SAM protein n=1 Tax=Thermodesulfobacterium hydrogeniphilum TaxID=161156 RepID=UPI00056EF855|nr:radical SAM protein [Thermodesulfobacterium hydrogeniphilum]